MNEKTLKSDEEIIDLNRIISFLSEINKEHENENPVIRDKVFQITHRIEGFINHNL